VCVTVTVESRDINVDRPDDMTLDIIDSTFFTCNDVHTTEKVIWSVNSHHKQKPK